MHGRFQALRPGQIKTLAGHSPFALRAMMVVWDGKWVKCACEHRTTEHDENTAKCRACACECLTLVEPEPAIRFDKPENRPIRCGPSVRGRSYP